MYNYKYIKSNTIFSNSRNKSISCVRAIQAENRIVEQNILRKFDVVTHLFLSAWTFPPKLFIDSALNNEIYVRRSLSTNSPLIQYKLYNEAHEQRSKWKCKNIYFVIIEYFYYHSTLFSDFSHRCVVSHLNWCGWKNLCVVLCSSSLYLQSINVHTFNAFRIFLFNAMPPL